MQTRKTTSFFSPQPVRTVSEKSYTRPIDEARRRQARYAIGMHGSYCDPNIWFRDFVDVEALYEHKERAG